jgi:hypothetical protein
MFGDKSHIHLHETVIEMTLLCYLKTAVKKNLITTEIQGERLVYYAVVSSIQFGFIITMTYSIMFNIGADYNIYFTESYFVLLCKFAASMALH